MLLGLPPLSSQGFARWHKFIYQILDLIVETFEKVYVAVTESPNTPPETSILFGYFDWDKGKELRRRLVNSFLNSNWPPGDIALSIPQESLLRKIFKRIMRRWNGERYIQAILEDLGRRDDPSALQHLSLLKNLSQNPDFYEPWD